MLTVIAAVFGIYSSRRANIEMARQYDTVIAELKADRDAIARENRKLNEELSCLTIIHPDKLHAVKVKTYEARTWSYRVYLPKGRQYYFACQVNSLPLANALPAVTNPPDPKSIGLIDKNSTAIGRPHGEYIVTLSVGLIENQWKYSMDVRKPDVASTGAVGTSVVKGPSSSTSTSVIDDVDGKWPLVQEEIVSGGVSDPREISLEKLPLVLLNFRAMNEGVTNSADSSQGCMLWVGTSN